MADFKIAFALTMGHEGEYSFDPDDRGGETYRGISRIHNPGWTGWKIIDDEKIRLGITGYPLKGKVDQLNNVLRCNTALDNAARDFYQEEYWKKSKCHLIEEQELCNEIFDNAVNMGVGRAIELIQKACNLLNRNQSDWKDIKVDCGFGTATLEALLKCIKFRGLKFTFNVVNMLQAKHYIEWLEQNPIQEKFYGVFKRVKVQWN